MIPVTSTSDSVDWSTNSGASAWIGRSMSDPIGPRSSIGSPITFMMRPRVFGPTGTLIGLPVSLTGPPRTRPSVESMAMVRTVFSPRCWATSSTRRVPLLSVSRAFRMAGSSPSNSTSTTAPMTWEIWPFAFAGVLMRVVSFGAGIWSCGYSASAPEIISISSLVIWAWRARLYCSSSESIISPALRVALSMAVIWLA